MSDFREANALLLVLADILNDVESIRIATAGRLRALTDEKGLPADNEIVIWVDEQLAMFVAAEKDATKKLERAMKAHPLLGAFVKGTVGLGPKQMARLLAAIGDPGDRENPAKLWQYCGHGDPLRSKRRRGEVCSHSPEAKMRVHLIAESAVKAGVRQIEGCDDSDGYDLEHRRAISPLGEVYLNARGAWADRDTSEGHRHNHALRLVGKAVLLDLWREARAV